MKSIFALLIAARTGWAFAAYSASDDADEIFYREYMTRLDGEYTEEKAQYLKDEMQSMKSNAENLYPAALPIRSDSPV